MKRQTIQLLSVLLLLGLFVWGIYTTIVYFGVPVHEAVMVTDSTVESINSACDGKDDLFCRGVLSIIPSLTRTVSRAAPFVWYALISLIFAVSIGAWVRLRSGGTSTTVYLSPLKLIGLFVLSVWLLITTLSFSTNGHHPFKVFFEPVPQVYTNAGPESLEALNENYQRLLRAGCLTYKGDTNHGAKVYHYTHYCLQKSFLTRVVPPLLLILFLLFDVLVLGRVLLSFIRLQPKRFLTEGILSAGLGVSALVALLWLLAVLGLYTDLAGWIVLLSIPLLGYQHAWWWIQKSVTGRWSIPLKASVVLLLGWLLLSYLALNFLAVIRPFPIGWDDLGRYLNYPRMMVSFGHLIPHMASFQWEYLSSLGYLLFGYDSTFGVTTAMEINWAAGLFAVAVVFAFGNIFLGKEGGVLAALLYYALPLVGHFSFADMKVDNGVFAMASISLLALFLYLYGESRMDVEESDDPDEPIEEGGVTIEHDSSGIHVLSWVHRRFSIYVSSSDRDWKYLVLAGIFGGIALSMKPTAAMVIMAAGAMLVGSFVGWTGFISALFFVIFLYISQGNLNLSLVASRIAGETVTISQDIALLGAILLGTVFLLPTLIFRRSIAYTTLLSVAIFAGSFLLTIAPWMTYNNIAHGRFPPSLEFRTPNTLSPYFVRHAGEKTESREGQVVRSLPPDLYIDPTHPACISTSREEELDRYWGFTHGWSHYLTLPWRTIMNLDSAGYYVTTMPALFLFPLLLFVPYLWMKKGKWALWLFWGTLLILVQWMFLANGIPWYGVGVFLGLVIGLETLVRKSPDIFSRTLAGILITFSLVSMFAMRFWQYDQQRNLLEYSFGKSSSWVMQERTVPHYDDIREIVMGRLDSLPDRPYLYRMGTFIPYFIPRNLEVIPLADNQLDYFKCLHQEKDNALTLRRLKALGFNSIIFDTNVATIERDPNGTLHQKVNLFLDFVNDPSLNLPILINDLPRGVAFILIP